MAISISNAVPVAQMPAVRETPRTQVKEAAVARASTDTVKLTQSGQIHALKQQGQGASQIADSLGVTVASVNSVLGIVVAKVATPVADIKMPAADAPGPSKAEVAATAPVGVQAGPTSAVELNAAKG